MNAYSQINKLKVNELKTIGYYTGYLCIFMSIMMIVPIIIAIIYQDNTRFLHSFIYSSIITIISGLILLSIFKKRQLTNLSLKGSLIFVLSIWGLLAIFSGLPYFMSGELGFFDSFFEAMSCITTTGFSLIPEQTHAFSFSMWKALTQWFGGLGIIVLLLVIVPSSGSLKRLFFAEGRTEQMTPNVKHTMMIFIKLYIILTSLGVTLYLIAGLSLFEAICFSFSSIATGGYSIYNDSHIFTSLKVQVITMFLMLLGSTNFVIHYRIIKGDVKNLFKDVELRAMAIIITVFTFLVMLSLYMNGGYNQDLGLIFRHSIFHVISVMTSSGFVSTELSQWPVFTYYLLMILTFIGGSICSTSGGIKLYNVVILFKSIWWEVEEMILPKNAIKPKRVFHDKKYRDISKSSIKTILIMVISYMLIFLLGMFVLLFYCNDVQLATTLSALSIGNTGIHVDYISVNMPLVVKIVLIIEFWVGRISVWPLFLSVIYLINRAQSNVNKILNN